MFVEHTCNAPRVHTTQESPRTHTHTQMQNMDNYHSLKQQGTHGNISISRGSCEAF